MSRARELAKLGNTDAIGIDGVDLRTGSITKGTQLDVASNVNVTGVITAANFIGNASGLTGLGAVGSGVTVLRDNNSLGAITKLNFDGTFTLTDPAAGLSTVTSGVTTADPRSSTLVVAGISTLGGTKLTGVTTASNQVNLENTNVTSGILTVSGQTILSNVNVTSGIATVAGQTNLNNTSVTAGILTVSGQTNLTNVNVAVSATCVNGTITNLSGTAATITELNLGNGGAEISGFSTFSNGGVSVVGMVTASQGFKAPGKTLTIGSIDAGAGTQELTFNGAGLDINGQSKFQGISTFTANIDANADLDVDGKTDLDDVSIAGVATFAKAIVASGNVSVSAASTFSAQVVFNEVVRFNDEIGTGLTCAGIATATGVNVSGIITSTGHVDTGITTYYGDSSYSAALRWVLGADGSNHYTFTGPGLGHSTMNDPTLYLKRGQTYMFENKMGAHPFRIQSTTNGATGTAWNVGVTNNDVSNGVLIFEVPFATPDTLYYQCTAHANMGGIINIA